MSAVDYTDGGLYVPWFQIVFWNQEEVVMIMMYVMQLKCTFPVQWVFIAGVRTAHLVRTNRNVYASNFSSFY